MTDLFTHTPAPQPKPGTGNAIFLADLANGSSAAQLRANHKQGRYPDLSPAFATANLKFWRLA